MFSLGYALWLEARYNWGGDFGPARRLSADMSRDLFASNLLIIREHREDMRKAGVFAWQ